jgi:hypothetical protein
MARTLKTFVTVHRRDDQGELTGESGTFGPKDDPKDELPGWARTAITNPDVWDGADDSSDDGASAVEVPPRGGPGSGAPAWRSYARSIGVEVADDASREDVIEALEDAGKPTE